MSEAWSMDQPGSDTAVRAAVCDFIRRYRPPSVLMPATYAEKTATAIQVRIMRRPGIGAANVMMMAISTRITAEAAPTAEPNNAAANNGLRSPMLIERIPKYAPRNGPNGASNTWAMGMIVHTNMTASVVTMPLSMAEPTGRDWRLHLQHGRNQYSGRDPAPH